jgi:rhamnose transport system permease protein
MRPLISRRDWIFALITAALIAAVSVAFPQFIAPHNLADLLDDSSILILLALGQMLVILTRGIDLSAAANAALSGMIVALFNRSHPQVGALGIIPLALFCGGILGAINGGLVWRLRLPPIVVTLGTMSIYRGAVYVVSRGTWVHDNELSRSFLGFVRQVHLGLTSLAWLAIAAVGAAIFTLNYSVAGRNLYAAGGNPTAAAYAGIDPGRMQFTAYTVCGAIAGVCGYLWVARYAIAYTDVALGFELQVIAACLIGGVAIAGGIGTVIGVTLGCLFIGVIRSALPLIGVSPFWQMGINGFVIVLAALISARQRESSQLILETGPA